MQALQPKCTFYFKLGSNKFDQCNEKAYREADLAVFSLVNLQKINFKQGASATSFCDWGKLRWHNI